MLRASGRAERRASWLNLFNIFLAWVHHGRPRWRFWGLELSTFIGRGKAPCAGWAHHARAITKKSPGARRIVSCNRTRFVDRRCSAQSISALMRFDRACSLSLNDIRMGPQRLRMHSPALSILYGWDARDAAHRSMIDALQDACPCGCIEAVAS